jgi:hypothetical protein
MFMGRKSQRSCDSVKVPEISHKRLKDITVKHILDNFKKIGKPGLYDHALEENSGYKRNSLRFSTAEQAGWTINIEDMHRLIRMCGGDLDKFESFYLLKRSNYGSQHVSTFQSLPYKNQSFESTRDVTISDFTDAVESLMNDVSTEAAPMINYLFKLKFGEQADVLSLAEVKGFLNEFDSYFRGDDRELFIRDIELGLLLEGDRVAVSDIA